MRGIAGVGVAIALCGTTGAASGQDGPINRVIQRLQQNQATIGTFTRAPGSDLDFAVIDTQYGEFDIDAVRQAVAGLRGGSGVPAVTPIVRIPLEARDAPHDVVRQLLEVGVKGVMFPDIETREHALAAVGSIRVHAGLWPADPSGTIVAMLQIESRAGIAALDEILAVPGVGAIFLGPTDLARSIGADGPNAAPVDALVQEVLDACLATGVPCGYPIVARTREEADRETTRRLAEGFKVLAVMTTGR